MVMKDPKIKSSVSEVLKKIIYVPTDERLTFGGGLPTLMELFESSGLEQELLNCLPDRTHSNSIGSTKLAYTIMFSFLFGYECLSDIDRFRKDPALAEIFNDESAAARTIGDFLRDFDEEHIKKLNQFLEKMTRYIWNDLEEKLPKEYTPDHFVLDVDSTIHVQSGEKMEGLDYNYKGEWGLDSQQSYDQRGFSHGYQLRPGNTKSGVNASELIENTFLDDITCEQRRYDFYHFFRADSAYCNQEIIKLNLRKGLHFTITAHDGVTRWKSLIEKEGLVWEPWVYSEEEIKKAEKRGKALPRVEVSRLHWSPGWSKKDGSKLVFPIVIKRTWSEKLEKKRKKQERERGLFMDGFMEEEPWEYYAVVTNISLRKDNIGKKGKRYWSYQQVFEFHKKRGNAENFIREEKYNFRLKNYPCQKLLANHAYGQIAQIAHNLLRWVALILSPDKPHFSKKIRNNLLFIPAKIVHHSRQILMKVPRWAYKEVMALREACRFKPKNTYQLFNGIEVKPVEQSFNL